MSVEGWPQPKGLVEFAARDVAAALGAQLLPQPVAYCIGGPVDGQMIANRDGLYETPGLPPDFCREPSNDDLVRVTRYSYVPKSERPFYDSEVVTHFEIA